MPLHLFPAAHLSGKSWAVAPFPGALGEDGEAPPKGDPQRSFFFPFKPPTESMLHRDQPPPMELASTGRAISQHHALFSHGLVSGPPLTLSRRSFGIYETQPTRYGDQPTARGRSRHTIMMEKKHLILVLALIILANYVSMIKKEKRVHT